MGYKTKITLNYETQTAESTHTILLLALSNNIGKKNPRFIRTLKQPRHFKMVRFPFLLHESIP